MVCEKCEKKLGTVITPDTWKDGARNTTDLIHMERISSPLAEFVKVPCTNRVLITARAVPTKRASVQCVEKRFWTPKTTSKHLCRYIDDVSGFLHDFTFCFEFSRHNIGVQVTK
ncbi:cysteine-rich PDZ-binding protein isoform X1 [Canis lupus baileyi]|uniref:cysteine-rich PDZ-binding protein isoform X1 n=1 Tax=Canis lupus baileyi TaxID=143281 RepID=UPI00005A2199|eukprot:XP_013972988.1 cysteine-rich PDZ-binding protein isoform X1 [Canis lupus familiaris]